MKHPIIFFMFSGKMVVLGRFEGARRPRTVGEADLPSKTERQTRLREVPTFVARSQDSASKVGQTKVGFCLVEGNDKLTFSFRLPHPFFFLSRAVSSGSFIIFCLMIAIVDRRTSLSLPPAASVRQREHATRPPR